MSGLQDFAKSATNFSIALSVFGVSQGGKVFKGLPTNDPTAEATESFNEVNDTIQEQYDGNDRAVFNTSTAVSDALIDITFAFFQPQTFNPATVLETGVNLARWGAGVAGQLVPGGVNKGGPPTGWGPVNREDAEITLPTLGS